MLSRHDHDCGSTSRCSDSELWLPFKRCRCDALAVAAEETEAAILRNRNTAGRGRRLTDVPRDGTVKEGRGEEEEEKQTTTLVVGA